MNSSKFTIHTVFPHIISSLKYFPPLNSFLTEVRKLFKFLLHKGKINEETIWNFQGLKIPKKNSCRDNYMRKYGIMYEFLCSCFKKFWPLTSATEWLLMIFLAFSTRNKWLFGHFSVYFDFLTKIQLKDIKTSSIFGL